MRIAIIGKGTSAIITALVLLRSGHKVTIFYDPKQDALDIGESTTPTFPLLISEVLGLDIHTFVDQGIFSYKAGINFIDWGNGKQFYENFWDKNTLACHFHAKIFNEYINDYLEKNLLVEYFPERVERFTFGDNEAVVNGKSFDFVVNCSGWCDKQNSYESILETVNSVVLFKKKYKEYCTHHTMHLATEDGWQFGLPFPKQDIFKCGYCYDNNIISKKDVLSKLPEDIEITGEYTWTPRYSKNLIENPFYASNGNRLFFFEPLQALSLHYYVACAELICYYLEDRDIDKWNMNYLDYMYDNQMCLAFHYHFGSIYDTDFWYKVPRDSCNLLRGSKWGLGEMFERKVEYDRMTNAPPTNSESQMGPFQWRDHLIMLEGMSTK
jgi:hypothetical protein